jgi:hypothetical protein
MQSINSKTKMQTQPALSCSSRSNQMIPNNSSTFSSSDYGFMSKENSTNYFFPQNSTQIQPQINSTSAQFAYAGNCSAVEPIKKEKKLRETSK